MKIFDMRFICGTVIVFVGLFGIVAGIILFFPPIENKITALIATVLGCFLIKVGFVIAKNKVPRASKIEIQTLDRAKIIKKSNKR